MELSNNSIIIAEYDYNKVLYQYKNQHPQLNIKIYQKKDLIDKLSFLYIGDPIKYLIHNKNMDYSKAKQIVSYLKIANLNKNEYLLNLYNDLKDKGYIAQNPLSSLELKGYNIYIFEAKEDKELHAYLNRNGYKYLDITFSDLDIKPKFDINESKLKVFENKYYQYLYIFSDIYNKIIDSKLEIIDGSNYTLLVDNEYDLYYVNTISNLFNIPVYTVLNKKLLEKKETKPFILKFYNNKKIDLDEVKGKNATENLIIKLIKNYELDKLPFDFGYANLLEILSSYTTSESFGDKGVTITSSFNINDSNIYITNFKHNSFYKEYSDNAALSDEILKMAELNTSYDKTRIDRIKKLNYIKYNNISCLSTIELHLKDSIFDSQFIKELGLKDFKEKAIFNLDGNYTTKAQKILYANVYDKEFYHGKNDEYSLLTYDNKYKGINNPVYSDDKTWYLTNLESYINCPFRYYLSDLIPLKDDDYTARCIGTYIHKVYEKIYHDDFNLDDAFNDAEEEYKKFYKEKKIKFTNKDKAYIEYLKYWLRKIIPTILNIKNETRFSDLTDVKDFEISVSYELSSYKLKGRIDKIIYAENEGNKIYYIVDYKSGEEEFDFGLVHLGKSIQLPLYYYAIENFDPDIKRGGEFAGFAIQHSYFKTPKKIMDSKGNIAKKDLLKYSMMNGLTSSNEDYKALLGSDKFYNYLDGFDDLTSNIKIKSYSRSVSPYDYSFMDIVEESKDAAINTIEKILDNNFEIAPTPLDLNSDENNMMTCRYCGYRDVCYRKSKDFKYYKEEIMKHFEALLHKEPNEEEEESDAI